MDSDFATVLHAVGPFILGLAFTTLASLQSGHSVHGLWARAFATSVCIGGIQHELINWAATGSARFWMFQAGAALGAAFGSVLCQRLGQLRRKR